MDNHAALTYLVKMERTRNLLMIQEATEIWEFCLANQIPLTAEYLPGLKNTRKDKAAKNLSSKWPLNKPMFQKLIQASGPVDMDLVASRLCHQIPMGHKLATRSTCMDGGFISNKLDTCLPTFCSYKESVSQRNERLKCTFIIITSWYIQSLRMSIQDLISFHHFEIFWWTQTRTNTHCVRLIHWL